MNELITFLEENNFPIMQENGQRTVGPPSDWEGPQPAKGSEVFIKQIPRDATESDVLPIFMQIGKIYMFRLMMDFSGTNRGYGFLQYCDPKTAKKAAKELNCYPIRPGNYLRVSISVDNRRLFFGKIPKTLTKETILKEVSSLVDGVEQVIMYKAQSNKSLNRGFCFVDFTSHRQAALARRTLVTCDLTFGSDIKVDWAIPEDNVDDDIMKMVTTLYIRNLMMSTSEKSLIKAISLFVDLDKITRVRKVNDFAFVHFTDRGSAEKTKGFLDGFMLDSSELEARWARPPRKDKPAPYLRNGHSIDINGNHEMTTQQIWLNQTRPISPVGPELSSCMNGCAPDIVPSFYRSLGRPLNINQVALILSQMNPTQALHEILKIIGWGSPTITICQQNSCCQQYAAEIIIRSEFGFWQFPSPSNVISSTPQEASDNVSWCFIQRHVIPILSA